ncbi:MAG: FG-GAP repeat domain-containing protein [Planctomycetota bacterium]
MSALLLVCASVTSQSPFRVTRFAALPLVSSPFPAQMARGDVDGDGDLDLVVVNDFLDTQVLINDGRGGFVDETASRLVSPVYQDSTCVDLADIDGDGDLDVLVGNEDGVSNEVHVNDGAGVFTNVTWSALPYQAFDTKNSVVADFDGDGDADWLAVGPDGSRFYENNGVGVFSDRTAAWLSAAPISLGSELVKAPEAADLDGDGDLDVLLAGANGLLLNQGGAFAVGPWQPPYNAHAQSWLADFDGDGDVDIVSQSGRALYQNQGNAVFVDVTASAGLSTTQWGLGAFDIDLDGDVDILTSTHVAWNDGAGVFHYVPSPAPVTQAELRAAVAADYDGDGDLEPPGLPNLLRHVDAPAPPGIGSGYAVELHTRPGAVDPGVLIASIGGGALSLGPYGTLQLDPATAVVVGSQVGATPLVVTWTLPNLPALVGTPLHYQGVVLDALQGLVITNTFGELVQ